jgi:hypothetical protein
MSNTGKTPARKVDMIAQGQTLRIFETLDFATQVLVAAKAHKLGDVLLPPNASASQTLRTTSGENLVSETELQDYKNGNPRFIVYGQATYNDIFDRPHWLTFCSYLGYEKDEPADNQWSWKYCEEHNDTGDGSPPVHIP